jgi:hypothetical protein
MTGLTRRAVLRGGGSLGLTAVTAAATGALGAVPAAAGEPPASTPARHLVPDYRPSQPTGLPPLPGQSDGTTLGGHIAAEDFTYKGSPYRISLLPSGRPGDAPDPVYRDVPSDPALRFRETLDAAWGSSYAFRYLGGFAGRDEFRVQSYGVTVVGPTADDPATVFGGGMYVEYEPDLRRGDPPLGDTLHWIQVVMAVGALGRAAEVDAGLSNPFYPYGGLTPINGNEVFNFIDMPQIGIAGVDLVDTQLLAETFLAEDTGRKDAAGKEIVNVYGGIAFGWQVGAVQA